MKYLSFALAVSSFALTSCAFKESASEQQEKAQRRMDGRFLGMSLSWDRLEKPIQFSKDDFVSVSGTATRDPVVSIPANPPETLSVGIQLAHEPQDVKAWTATAIATTGDDLSERELGAHIEESIPADLGTIVKVKLEGASTLFVRDREQRIYLTVNLKTESGTDAGSYRLVVSTPPSRLTVLKNEMTIGKAPQGISANLITLKSQAESRILIRRIVFRNDSFEKVRLTIPFKSRGKFNIRGTVYRVESVSVPHMTAYAQKKEDKVWDIESDIYIFPLIDEIAKTWTSFTQSDLNSVLFEPLEVKELGLYATQDFIQQISSHPVSKPQTQSLALRSVARCNPNADVRFPPLDWVDLFDGSHSGGWNFPPDTIALMKRSIQQMQACVNTGRAIEPCNQAALIDEQLDQRRIPHPANGIPWMVYFGCNMGDWCPGDHTHTCRVYPGWSWSAEMSDFQLGIQTFPITVDWKDAPLSFTARFAPELGTSAAEARVIPLANSGLVIRD